MLAAAGRPASGKSPGTSVESCKRYFIAPRTNRSTWKITSPKAIECELQLRKDVYLSITCHQQPQALMQTTSRHKKYTKTMQVPMEEAGKSQKQEQPVEEGRDSFERRVTYGTQRPSNTDLRKKRLLTRSCFPSRAPEPSLPLECFRSLNHSEPISRNAGTRWSETSLYRTNQHVVSQLQQYRASPS